MNRPNGVCRRHTQMLPLEAFHSIAKCLHQKNNCEHREFDQNYLKSSSNRHHRYIVFASALFSVGDQIHLPSIVYTGLLFSQLVSAANVTNAMKYIFLMLVFVVLFYT